MADAVAHRVALLQLATELREATTRAEQAVGGTEAEMLAAVVDLAHRIASVALLHEAVSRDMEELAQRAEAAELRGRRTLRGALRGLVLDLLSDASRSLRRSA